MREMTANMLLSEADALVFGALLALLIESFFRGAFSNPPLAALLAFVMAAVVLTLLAYLHNIFWYGEFVVKGLGKNSRAVYSLVSALDLTAFSILCMFALPVILDHYGAAAAIIGGAVPFMIVLAIQGEMWRRTIGGTVSANKLWRSQNQWGVTGLPLAVCLNMLASGLLGGLAGIAAGALLGWAPLFVQMYYSTQRTMEYSNRFSMLFFPAIISLDISLFFATVIIWYFNGLGVPLTTIALVYSALIIAEIAMILCLYRAKLLKITPKRLNEPVAQAH